MIDPTKVRLAQEIVTQRHCWEGRQRYRSLPYTHHLEAVANLVAEYADLLLPADLETLTLAAWLHDLLEDTDTKRKEIDELFGSQVAAVVWAVTNEPGPSRATRHATTYPKIRAEPLAVLLKLCDRLANVQAGGSLVDMYRREHEDFRRALYTPGQWDAVWARLDAALRA